MNKKKLLDKLLMGAVIGGAIGSVVGASIKHNKNQKKQNINTKVKEVIVNNKPNKTKFSILKRLFSRKKNNLKEIPNEL